MTNGFMVWLQHVQNRALAHSYCLYLLPAHWGNGAQEANFSLQC